MIPRENLSPLHWIRASFCRIYQCRVADIMVTMASQIIGVSIVYLTVCSGADQRKTSKLRITGLCEENSTVISSQRASNAGNISVWWRHQGKPSEPWAPTENFLSMLFILSITPENDIWLHPGHYLRCVFNHVVKFDVIIPILLAYIWTMPFIYVI